MKKEDFGQWWASQGDWDTGTKVYPKCVTASTGSVIYTVTVNVPNQMDAVLAEYYANCQLSGSQQFQWQSAATNWYSNLAQTAYLNTPAIYPHSVIYQQPWAWDNNDETPEQKTERLKRKAQREAAALRAENLLFTILTPSQVKQYKDDDYFEVPVNDRIYRLRKGRSMNVELIEAGKPKIKFCAHPNDAHDVPIPDVLVSQLLMLKANEAEFLRIANRQVLQ